MPTTADSEKVAYANCMEQIVRRRRFIEQIIQRQTSYGDDNADSEAALFHIRRILELIAFAGLSANRELYSTLRSKIEHEWRAKTILDTLAKLQPDFYPIPFTVRLHQDGRKELEPLTDGFLTRDEFAELYDLCSEALHEWNPFRPGPRQLSLPLSIPDWVARIDNLLRKHYVKLIGQTDRLVVTMIDPIDGKPHVRTAVPNKS